MCGHKSGRGLCLYLICLALPILPARPGDGPGKPAQPEVDYIIVVTGGELLQGSFADGHTVFLTRTLLPLGLNCVGSMIVDDRPGEIQEALRFAARRAKLTIVTGGLGPTENDVTREALSEFTGIAFHERPELLADLERRFQTPRTQLRPNLRRQIRVPDQGHYLKNPNGTAVGLVFEKDGQTVVALPGPPRELQPMVRQELIPYLSHRFGSRRPGASFTVRFLGLGQSQISQTLQVSKILPAEVIVFSQFDGSRVDYTFALADNTPQSQAKLADLKKKIFKLLGDNIYGEGETTLEEHVAGLLELRGGKLVLAEVGSGGALAAALATTDRGRKILGGAYVASTEEQLGRLLRMPERRPEGGAEPLLNLAAAAAQLTGGPWVVAVGEPRPGPNGLSFVNVALRSPEGSTDTRRLGFRGSGALAHGNLINQILDFLRGKLRKPGLGENGGKDSGSGLLPN